MCRSFPKLREYRPACFDANSTNSPTSSLFFLFSTKLCFCNFVGVAVILLCHVKLFVIICKIGDYIFNFNSLVSYIRNKQAKNKVVRVIYNNCTGCQRCLKKCGREIFDMVNDETGVHIVMKYSEKCTACEDCIAVVSTLLWD